MFKIKLAAQMLNLSPLNHSQFTVHQNSKSKDYIDTIYNQ